MRPACVLLLLFALGCKRPGARTITIERPEACRGATHAAIYLLRGTPCGGSSCALSSCSSPSCIAVCGGGLCPIEDLDRGVVARPTEAGFYAAAYQLVVLDDAGIPTVLCGACAEVEVEANGVASSEIPIVAAPCAPQSDAGAD